MPTPAQIVAEFLFRAGTFLLITAWLIGSAWFLWVVGLDIYKRWGAWSTYPVPDKKAVKHIIGYLLVLAVNLLFLWFAVVWFSA